MPVSVVCDKFKKHVSKGDGFSRLKPPELSKQRAYKVLIINCRTAPTEPVSRRTTFLQGLFAKAKVVLRAQVLGIRHFRNSFETGNLRYRIEAC